MEKIITFLRSQKKEKIIGGVVLLTIILVLIGTSIFGNEVQTKEPIETAEQVQPEGTWEDQVGKSYTDFSDSEMAESKKAIELAEAYYEDEVGELRDTSVFFAETLKNGSFMVSGIDTLDGRDTRFILLQVNISEKTVEAVDRLTQD